MTAEPFEQTVAALDPPMYIVTTEHAGQQAGCLVGFASQCSIEPPRFVVWISEKNRTCRVASGAEVLGVHVLRAQDHDLAMLFGGETGDDVDKFAQVEWRVGPFGIPVLDRCDWFLGYVVDTIDNGGDHVGFVLLPFAGEHHPWPDRFLGYQDVRDVDAGHEA